MSADRQQLLAEIAAFEQQQVSVGEFDHHAHLRVAWCYLTVFEPAVASARFDKSIRALTEALGVADKYHATITGFFLLLISERIARSGAQDWDSFKRDNADLFCTPRDLLAAHYSAKRLQSSLARRQFLLPDLAATATATPDAA